MNDLKLWVDDVRPAPEGYVWCSSVNEAIAIIEGCEGRKAWRDKVGHPHDEEVETIHIIDLDHDLGDYAKNGGDGVKLLDWLEETGRNYPIRLHSTNPVGVQNMRRIIQRNGWKEVFL